MKQWLKPLKIEWITWAIVTPFLCILINNLLFGSREFNDPGVWLVSFPLLMMIGTVSWYTRVIVMHWLRVRFPSMNQTTLRLSILALFQIGLMTWTFTFIFYLYDIFHIMGYHLDTHKLRFGIYCGIGIILLSTSLWEFDYTFLQWKDSLVEKERMEQLTMQMEFETLKSQVNPHFLFNCFNTLSSLISEDKKQAETFLNELSKVYRYLLRNNEDGLSTVQTEIRFIESYYQLLKTRHGDAVELKVEIDKKYIQYLLPSLTLQLLVENAVKHNVLSKNKPLLIDIFTTAGNKLVVSNNRQPRTVKGPSNRIGLENIRAKYELLNYHGFQVLDDTKSFSVVLPLIWNTIADQKLKKIELT
jgi:sensor histidine kinase YesM